LKLDKNAHRAHAQIFRAVLCNNHKGISIKWNLFAWFIIFTVTILSLLWFFQVIFLDEFYKSIKINEIKSTADYISKYINNEDIEELIYELSKNNEVCISIYDSSMNIKYSSDIIRECIIHRVEKRGIDYLYENALKNNGELLVKFSDDIYKENLKLQFNGPPPPNKRNMDSIIFTKIVKSNNETYVIFLNSIISPVDATVKTLRVQLIYITAILIVLSLALAFIISKIISKPIIKINKAAKILATGDYNVKFDDEGYTEISELGQTLNYTAKELSNVENLRRELIANISHDLRTPLTMITGYAEVMKDLPGENTPENIQIIIDEAERLSILVNDILDISKFQSGVQKLNVKRFDLTELINNILKRYTKLTQQEGYKIIFEHASSAVVLGDELKISQVVYNLINNAMTYTGNDKTVYIKQITDNKKVKIEIIDTGDGIPEDKISYIWDRYYKINNLHKRAVVGTGLGLSIVKSILDMHNAEYGVESDMGTMFWFKMEIA